MTTDKFGQPYGSSWEGMSMGEGRKVDGWEEGACPNGTQPFNKPPSPDTKHHYTAVTNVQSVEHFVCDHCDDEWYD